MAKSIKLIIVPGMGKHTAKSFKKEFIDSFKQTFNLYQDLNGQSIEDYAEIIPFDYNIIIDRERERMANHAKPINDRLDALKNIGGKGLLKKLIQEITKIESSINDDDFFKTHWLDVFFYRFTTLGEEIRIKLAKVVNDRIINSIGDAQNVHLLGHSLGCSIIHDTLAKQFSDDATINYEHNLSINTHKLGSINMIANTSRVLESFIDVKKSLVKPGPTGCAHKYNEFRHALDPITWPKPFNPTDNGQWISSDRWNIFKSYNLKRLTSLTNEHGNVHDISHYIFNPLVHREIMQTILGISLTEEQKQNGYENFYSKTFSGVAGELQNSLESLKRINIENISGLFKAIRVLKDFVEDLGGHYNA